MGEYEHIETGATVEIDSEIDGDILRDLGYDPKDAESINEFLTKSLEHMLADEIEDAATHTAHEDSFVLPYADDETRNERRK